ncbi:hypothetical protein GGH91_000261 [Coemansia sp. RSA 2671]|uniref:Uncharacterized protein n=2 Tax=Coemansia TaxID=4863 RepID=A0A9W8GN16_9FUNG|nr:hypothetical protein LPJ60_001413 [Coemansia sp. RSA 2675]KAJ2026844.1 hypothetical protein IWW57_002893 [Coemansia sp. S610]KAJ2350240.1 hypothetical protein GGH91_000261 [Coemansia sp. RSA 2671]KAJ2380114.1 hypothetical protein H4S02_006845 [Coemansia sp. RSA 2611]KAJ2416655.1 hypothetical protein GGI10_000807 [Coemansia sp. RSA 2530]KAJ2691320.1 hypothetical protein IWW39_000005 [Coemansia spiralis]KAJ2697798.1 hypothetical protein H4218_003715 [Coemansia sp. IMI 209128]KAJ2769467.1 hy
MRTFAFLSLLSACAIAAPLVLRQLPGDSVNGPTALSHPNINNGESVEGSVEDETSLNGAVISNAMGNTLTKVTQNTNWHDNEILNPNVNSASNTQGDVVVGNGNQVFPGMAHGHGIVFRRQGMVNGPTALSNPKVNNGASTEGSLDAGVSANGATVVNPVGNDLTQVNSNQEVADNSFVNPNWNQISGNNGPAMAGNNNIFVPVTNEAGAIQIDNGDLLNAALMAGSAGKW